MEARYFLDLMKHLRDRVQNPCKEHSIKGKDNLFPCLEPSRSPILVTGRDYVKGQQESRL